MKQRTVAAVSGFYVAMLSGFLVIDAQQTRLWLLMGSLSLIAVTSAYLIRSLAIDLWRSLEDVD